ncbi:non-ribosomal peptide synthetase [Paraburkholderia phenazinium]|uniref:Non-ribosomal peptide synthase domain TIGR01720/amino acid adenylation domain-containing protein/thioester reductase domain-containing protein n=1 Tax=Paraburkholderia phenazinium TaxID=60549 RepID=A0A1N6GPF9_9BURK|nr:non-ribosomal peptide synthetase [Paraburkholderia phenazinium]SIO09335.1 non-ribosomal peptide synthase domain TIGR01720/amino acid adenylation domain-containing protein/thioester reductase domain-containing protein [Paraburkholderia phenazinium]
MLLNQILRHSLEQPDQLAVYDGNRGLTYAELERVSAWIAEQIHAMPVTRGALVAVYQDRGALMVASIVGIWRSGGAYTVVEAEGIAEEHYHRLGVIGPDVVLTTEEHATALVERGFRVCIVDRNEAARAGVAASSGALAVPQRTGGGVPDTADLAYVLFTSGSTGVPKGVMVTHGNIAHYVRALIERLDVRSGLTYAHVSTMSADLGNTSLFLSLWTGGTLHVIDDSRRKDPSALLAYLQDQRIKVLKITPSHWEAIFSLLGSAGAPQFALKYLILGGEALSVKLARAVLDAGITERLVNHYGPTETTVGITAYPIPDGDPSALPATGTAPIGLPLGETKLIVQTSDGSFVDTGAQGELYVGGPSVSAGYRNNAQANEKAFVAGPGGHGRFYRTGDIVRIDERGVVHFLGRVDRQVKVNGYRIELEQIERALKSLDGCEGAAAFLIDVRERPSIAAAVLARGQVTGEEWKTQLGGILPAYMIPRELQVFSDFPLTPNGKTDLARLRALLDERIKVRGQASVRDADGSDDAVTAVREAWRQCLGHDRFTDSDNFFSLGGDSLDAIGVIARLQAGGYRVSARSFLKEPTVRALARSVRAALDDAPVSAADNASVTGAIQAERFSAAQRTFFAQRLARPDHHNQALMFDVAGPLSVDILRQAFERVRDWHPLLSTRYRWIDDVWTAEQQSKDRLKPVLEITEIPATQDPDDVAVLVRRTSQALQASLSLEAGRVFAAHLFRRESGASHLVLCAHHVVVDAVSWRILVDDVSRLYSSLLRTGTEPTAPVSGSAWDWAEHVASSGTLESDLDFWRKLPASVVQERLGLRVKGNLERHAKTVWLSFSRERTSELLRDLPEQFGAPFHHVLLASFLHAFDEAAASRQNHLVEVESHGRMTFDDDIDVSRTVGWFTSAYPVVVSSVSGELAGTVGLVDAALGGVPRLGIAYGVHRDILEREWGGVPAARFCYNYLGQFEFGDGDALTLRPSTLSPGFARGYDNDRMHEFRLTGRIIDGRLICDLGYSGERHDPATIHAIVERTAVLLSTALTADAGDPAVREGARPGSEHARVAKGFSTFIEAGSSAGLLTYRPTGLHRGESDPGGSRDRRRYRHVLMSGATGFLGAYVLRELLLATGARVHCIVRAATDDEAATRLAAAFDWYFPDTPLTGFGARVQAYSGDVAEERLGLGKQTYESLDREMDAIYHFAADTRLFADEDVLERQNITGTRRLVELASGRHPKDLHHMSTLAVCGVNQSGKAIVFSESTLDVGQDFLNAYERTKFKAEKLVREFALRGGRAFIYRSGNVSADSRSARFQRKAADNRFVQLLRAAVKIGSLPAHVGEPVALSPVDVVARGIVALSLDLVQGGGVYHVDTPWTISMEDVFDTLRELGIPFEVTSHATFAELFRSGSVSNDRDVALGYFWASRPERGIAFDHSRTLRILSRMSRDFEHPKREWLRAFLAHLVAAGVLSGQSALPA